MVIKVRKWLMFALAFVAGASSVLLVLTVTGRWRGVVGHVSEAGADQPAYIDIITSHGGGRRIVKVRDRHAIGLLKSVLYGGRSVDVAVPERVDAAVSGQTEISVFVPPVGEASFPYSPSPVWRQADGSFVWAHDGSVTELNGSIGDVLELLKIQRLSELLRSESAADRAIARAEPAAHRDEYAETLLRLVRSSNSVLADAALGLLPAVICDSTVGPPDGRLGTVQIPPVRSVRDLDHRVRDELLRGVAMQGRLLSAGEWDEKATRIYERGIRTLECLSVTGDRQVADELLDLLQEQRSRHFDEKILTTIEQLYGIPPTYERMGLCGNSTEEELARAADDLRARQDAAIEDLTAWRASIKDGTDDAFYEAVLLRWSEVLIHLAKTPPGYLFGNDLTPAQQVTNLLALGDQILPALRRRQRRATDWGEVGMLEFCISCLTKAADPEQIRKLLDGDVSQKRLACCVIAATGDSTWTEEVVAMLRTPVPDRGVEEVVTLREIAAQALFCSRQADAIPVFRQLVKDGYGSTMASRVLDWRELPSAEY